MLAWIFACRAIQPLSRSLPWAQRAYRQGGCCADILEMVDGLLDDARSTGNHLLLLKADIAKAFDQLLHQAIINQLAEAGLPDKFILMVVDMLTGLCARVRTAAGLSSTFAIERGIHQGCPLSPILFIITISRVVVRAAQLPTVRAAGVTLPALWFFADDISFAVCDAHLAQQALEAINQALTPLGLAIAPAKCEILEVNGGAAPAVIALDGITIPHSAAGWKLLGISYEANGWVSQQALTFNRLHGVLSRLACTGLSSTNTINAWSWMVRGHVNYVSPIADITATCKKIDQEAACILKAKAGLPPATIANGLLFTATSLGGLGLTSATDTMLAKQVSWLLRRHAENELLSPPARLAKALVDHARSTNKHDILANPPHRASSGHSNWVRRALTALRRTCSTLDTAPPGPSVDNLLDQARPSWHACTTTTHSRTFYTDGSASDNRAAWAVVDPTHGLVCSGRVWGAQSAYRGELSALYSAVQLAPSHCALTIHCDSKAAIGAVNSRLSGTQPALDAPSFVLVGAICEAIKQWQAPTTL